MSTYKNMINYFLILIGALIIVVLIFGSIVLNKIKGSEPLKVAQKEVARNPEIQRLTGGIKKFGYMVGGEMNDASASFNFNVIGQKKDLRIDCKLTKLENKSWSIQELTYE